MNRKDKVSAIKSLMTGQKKAKDFNPVIFCEYFTKESEPEIYYDQNGTKLTEEQIQIQIKEAGNQASITFHEIKTYKQ